MGGYGADELVGFGVDYWEDGDGVFGHGLGGVFYVVFGGGGWGVVAEGLGEGCGVPFVSGEVAEHTEGYDSGELVVVGAVDDYVVVLVGEEPLFGEGSDGEGLVGVGSGRVDDVVDFDAFEGEAVQGRGDVFGSGLFFGWSDAFDGSADTYGCDEDVGKHD